MKRQNILITILVVLLVGVGMWWYVNTPKTATTNAPVNTNTASEGPTLPTTITYQGQDGKNVLELLQQNHDVIESRGFVQGIDGRVGSKTSYWLWYVNGKEGPVGAQDYVTKSGETIEWRFISSDSGSTTNGNTNTAPSGTAGNTNQ